MTATGIRLMWDELQVWSSDAATQGQYVKDLADGGFNTLVVNAWRGGWCCWRNAWADHYPSPQLRTDYDAFASLLSLGKAHGITVYPYINLAQHLSGYTVHPEWYVDGQDNSGFYNVFNPGFRKWIADIVGEVCARYPIEGIALDYCRVGKVDQQAATKSMYAADTGRDFTEDYAAWSANASSVPAFSAWLVIYVEKMLDQVLDRVRVIRPGIPVMMYGIWQLGNESYPPVTSFTEYGQGRRIANWLNSGKIDLGIMGVYADAPDWAKVQADLNTVNPDKQDRMIMLHSNYATASLAPLSGNAVVSKLIEQRKRYPLQGAGLYYANTYTAEQRQSLNPWAL